MLLSLRVAKLPLPRSRPAYESQAVDTGSGNLAAEDTEVRVTEIIGDDQDEVWRR